VSGDAQKQPTGRANFLVEDEIDISAFKPTPARKPPVSTETIRAVSEQNNFPSREPPKDPAPKIAKPAPSITKATKAVAAKPRLTVHKAEGGLRRFRTNRNAQVNIKAEEAVRDKFNSICDQEGLVGGELLKRLLELYEIHQDLERGDDAKS
jgi:hypothetical protein